MGVASKPRVGVRLRLRHGTVLAVLCAGAAAALPPVATGKTTAPPVSWTDPVLIDHSSPSLDAISCPTTALCAAVGEAGTAVITTNATARKPTWRAGSGIDGANTLTAVSCPSTSLCVAVDNAGNAVRTANPTAAKPAWNASHVDGTNLLTAISCPSTSLCVAVDDAGNALSTTNPTAAAPTWRISAGIDGTSGLTGVSCALTSLCAAVNYSLGEATLSADPLAATPTWSAPATIDAMNQLVGIACPSAALCVAVDAEGNAVLSTDPGAPSPSWRPPATIDGSNVFAGVSCASTSLCVAVDAHGNAVVSTDPVAARPTWTGPKHIDSKSTMAGISCAPSLLCVAVDNGGYAVVGHVSPPTAAQIKASLVRQLAPHGVTATINALNQTRRYVLPFTSLRAGRAVIDWYYLPKGAHLAGGAASVLVAAGRATFSSAQTLNMTIRLTAPGRRLLKHSLRLKLTALGTFTPTGAHPVSATAKFTIRGTPR
jgi:hypothetical protein